MISKVIPNYAKDFKNEFLFILGINNEFNKYFLDNMNEATRELFENFRVDKIKKFIKLFLAYQNLGQFKDVSNFEIKSSDIKNLIKIKKYFNDFNRLIEYKKDCYDGDEQNFVVPYPGFRNIYDDFELFCSKFKIKYEADDRFWDYNADRDRYRYRYCFSDSDSDSDSD